MPSKVSLRLIESLPSIWGRVLLELNLLDLYFLLNRDNVRISISKAWFSILEEGTGCSGSPARVCKETRAALARVLGTTRVSSLRIVKFALGTRVLVLGVVKISLVVEPVLVVASMGARFSSIGLVSVLLVVAIISG
ncbi:hypothetical protein ACH5RR_008896 [Cinchona calisaya]|uniref:Uncharacterized protein n=1 Tax=Cinchona calisaya TaxID=153742 RepID=A0ABD3ACW2_9GENT